MFDKKDKEFLLSLARKSIKHYLLKKEYLELASIDKKFFVKRGNFVTLEKNNFLRGCIGTIYPKKELYKEIIENSVGAAFFDPRFPELSQDEIKEIKISISLLSELKKINFKNMETLLKNIEEFKDGIVIVNKNRKATFLPQVWNQLPDKIDFLTMLCQKAGIEFSEILNSEIYKYNVEYFSEQNEKSNLI